MDSLGISIAHQWIESTMWDAQVQECETFSSAFRSIRPDLAGLVGKLRGVLAQGSHVPREMVLN